MPVSTVSMISLFFIDHGNLGFSRFKSTGLNDTSVLKAVHLHIKHAMESTFSWDGTFTSGEFHVAAKALSERWKEMNPTHPPWTWLPSPGLSRVASGKEHCYEGSCAGEEESLDNAAVAMMHRYGKDTPWIIAAMKMREARACLGNIFQKASILFYIFPAFVSSIVFPQDAFQ